MNQINPEDYINIDKYPIHCPYSDEYRALMAEIHEAIEDDGCAVLKGFVHTTKISDLVKEADGVEKHAFYSHQKTNPYFTKDDASYPENHPIRRFYDRSNGFIPADNFGEQTILRAIYEWEFFAPFIQATLQEKNFYRYADPLADVIINAAGAGNGFPWHFDTNNYTVTLAIQNSEQGGIFEYAPFIRTASDENFEAVAMILDGDKTKIKSLNLEAGDLQIFKGRYTLHRVSPLQGERKRYVGIFSFTEAPNMVAKLERCLQIYGKALPIHYQQEQRADTLLD